MRDEKAQLFGSDFGPKATIGMRDVFLICVFGQIFFCKMRDGYFSLMMEHNLTNNNSFPEPGKWTSSLIRVTEKTFRGKSTFKYFHRRHETTMRLLMHSKSFLKSEEANPGMSA